MNLLALLQEFCRRVALPNPTLVIASQDEQYLQLVGMLHEVLDYLTIKNWVAFNREATFTTVATASQGSLSTIAPYGFMWMVDDTFFNRTVGVKVTGPISPAEWQADQAMTTAGSYYRYRINAGNLMLSPTPDAGLSMAFEYASSFAITDSAGTTYRQYYSADSDLCLLPDALMLAGLKWIWKRDSGFRYAEDFSLFENLALTHLSKDGTKPSISMDEQPSSGPGILIPNASWSV